MDPEMTLRDRFLATARFEPCPRTPRWELGYWAGALQRWYREGLTGTQQAERAKEGYGAWVGYGGDRDVERAFAMDPPPMGVAINYFVCPQYPTEILEETDDYLIRRDGNGIVARVLKPEQGMPHWIDYPVHTRREWEIFKAERYQPDLEPRLPESWDALLAAYRSRERPLCLGGAAGFFGTVRNIVGLELAHRVPLPARRYGVRAAAHLPLHLFWLSRQPLWLALPAAYSQAVAASSASQPTATASSPLHVQPLASSAHE